MVLQRMAIISSSALKLACFHRMLPGLNAAAVGLIVGSVIQLTLQIHSTSPFPSASMCIGERPARFVFGSLHAASGSNQCRKCTA